MIVNWLIFTKLKLAGKVCENACAEFHENPTKDSLCYYVTNSLTDGRGLHVGRKCTKLWSSNGMPSGALYRP
jgi:hypothetical protein